MRSIVQHSQRPEDAAGPASDPLSGPALLEAAFALAPVGLAVVDERLRYAQVNEAILRVTGRTRAELEGTAAGSSLPGLTERHEQRLLEVLQTGEPARRLALRGPSAVDPARERHWLLSADRLGAGPQAALGLTLLEVSERVDAEGALRAQRDLYDTLLRAQADLGEAVVLLEDEQAIYVNRATERITGRTAAELYALRSLLELFVPEERDAVARRIAAVLQGIEPTGTGFVAELEVGHGERRSVEVAAQRLEESGRERVVVLARDVTERLRQERERERLLVAEQRARRAAAEATTRAETLAAIGEALDRSMELRVSLPGAAQVICRQGVPVVGLYVCDRDGTSLRRMAVAQALGDEGVAIPAVENAFDLHSRVNPLAGVARTGRPFVELSVTEDTLASLRAGDKPTPVALWRRPGSLTALPLVARGHTVGVIALAWLEEGREVAEQELAWWQEVARRIALGINNAQLYAERAHIAATLQAGLLPPSLPEIPGVQAAARYLPAGEAAEVGGDFYDLFAATDGETWTVVVGDVCGKGPEAAAATAMVRYTLRAAAMLPGSGPDQAFTALNTAMLAEDVPERFVTVIAGRLRLGPDGAARLELAAGGHPGPLVVRADGHIEAPEVSGPVLGVVDGATWTSEELLLEPGDRVVLYTDGVSEASRAEPLEPEDLARELAALGTAALGRTAGDLADAVRWLAESRAGGPLRDDVAIVALSIRR